ncbi:MAG TPA: hypothetical protein VHJ20_12435 [Polyangia bacterium]|nr:hypothetical protein [Polyangia bacterium]
MTTMDISEASEEAPKNGAASIDAAAADAEEAAGSAVESVATAAADVGKIVSAIVEAHPVATLATTLGLGYLIGGGLGSPAGRKLLGAGVRFGARLTLLPALERVIAEAAGAPEAAGAASPAGAGEA